MTRWTVALAAAALLMFAGCDSKDSDEAKEYERTQALDNGEWDKVLSMTTNCGADEKCLMDRGAAYIGLAGFTLPNVISVITADDNDKWVTTLSAGKNLGESNASLTQAQAIYSGVIGDIDHCNKSKNYAGATYYQKAACIPQGMAIMAQAAVLIGSFRTDINGTDTLAAADTVAGLLQNNIKIIADLAGESVEAVDEIKDKICVAAGQAPKCTLTGTDLLKYKDSL